MEMMGEWREEKGERKGNRRLQMEGLRCRGGLLRKSLSSHFICVCLASKESNCIWGVERRNAKVHLDQRYQRHQRACSHQITRTHLHISSSSSSSSHTLACFLALLPSISLSPPSFFRPLFPNLSLSLFTTSLCPASSLPSLAAVTLTVPYFEHSKAKPWRSTHTIPLSFIFAFHSPFPILFFSMIMIGNCFYLFWSQWVEDLRK